MNRTKADRMSVSILILIFVSIITVPVVLTQLLIRAVYTSWLEPESTAGSLMLAPYVIDKQIMPQKRNILILGDSRINEGFSSVIANREVVNSDINFVSLGIAGSSPRIWAYLIKKIDPDKNKFYAIYVMTPTFSDNEIENFNDRVLDTSYLSAISKIEDVLTYPNSFDDPHLRDEARQSILFPTAALKNDIISFLKHPIERVRKVMLWKRDYQEWLKSYSGRSEYLPHMDSVENYGTLVEQFSEPKKSEIRGYFQLSALCNKNNTGAFRYRSKWFGDIGSYYRDTAITVGIFLIPRGPYHSLMTCGSSQNGALQVLTDKRLLKVLSSQSSLALENPEYFFDHLHMNKDGRNLFSQKLAVDIINSLKD